MTDKTTINTSIKPNIRTIYNSIFDENVNNKSILDWKSHSADKDFKSDALIHRNFKKNR